MSKFKSFASQSSFRDYQLQAPDESAKIKEQTAKVIRGKQRAEEFRQGNAAIYLQAQKLVQGLEEANREQNFQLETENRKAFIDQLNQEYQLRVQSDNQRLAVQQRNLQNLTQFSQTAMQLYGQYEKNKTDNQRKENAARVYKSGADYNTLVSIRGLADNLTKAEFAQLDFIRKKLEEGGDADLYFDLYKNRKTRGFINNIAVAQSVGRSFGGASNKFLADYAEQNPNATAEQTKLAWTAWKTEYIANIAPELNPDLLNDTVFNLVKAQETDIIADLDSMIKKERKEDVKTSYMDALNVSWNRQTGVQGFIQDFFTQNPDDEKRLIAAQWVVSKLEAGTMTPDEGLAILDTEYTRNDGHRTTWRKAHDREEGVGKINEAIRQQRRNLLGDDALSRKEKARAAELKARGILDQALAEGNGIVSDQAREMIEYIIENEAPPDYTSDSLETANRLTLNARWSAEALKEGMRLARNDNLTVAYVDTIGNYEVQKKLRPIAEHQDRIRGGDDLKSFENQIKAKIIEPQNVQYAPLAGIKNVSVLRRQNKAIQKMKRLAMHPEPDKRMPLSDAFGLVMRELDEEQKTPGAIDREGNYVSMLNEIESDMDSASKAVKFRLNFTTAAQDARIKTDAYYAVNSFGQDRFYKNYHAMMRGELPDNDLKYAAARMYVSPLEAMNFFAAGLSQPPIPIDARVEALRANLKPSIQRQYDAPHRTKEITQRLNVSNPNISNGYLPVRSSLQGIAATGENTGYQVTAPRDGASGVDFVIENGRRGAPYYFPVGGKVIKVVNDMNVEYRLDEDPNAPRDFGNYVEVQITIPELGNRVADVLIAHFDQVNDLKPGDVIPANTLLGTQGRTGSTTGAHISFDCYVPGSTIPDSVCRDWFRDNYTK